MAPRRPARFLVLAMLAAAFAGGCRGSHETPPINVVIVLIDTLRADRLGCYGHERATSPRIDALAREGVLFERAAASAPWTLPSVSSLFTGLLPAEHRVLVDGNRLEETVPTLAEGLASLGLATWSLHHNPYAGELAGLARGFDVCRLTERDTDGPALAAFLAEQQRSPFFLYVHNTEPHDPHEVAERHAREFGSVSSEERARIRRLSNRYRALTRVDAEAGRPPGTTDNTAEQAAALSALGELAPAIDVLYDAAVREADEHVGGIIDALVARGAWEDTLFVLTADHGEELGEHGGWQHDQSVYEELVRVPLIVRFPRGEHAGRRVRDVVALIDVLPTILDVLGRPELARGARGRSLLPVVRGEGTGDEPRVTTTRINLKKYYAPWKRARGDTNVVVRQGEWKLIHNSELGTVELYDLTRDPAEQDDRAGAEIERAAALREVSESFLREQAVSAATSTAEPRELDPAVRKRLEELGYAGGAEEEEER